MSKIVEEKLSYQIVGFCMKIHSELGKSCKEKYYQNALENLFLKNKLVFKKEIKVDLNFDGNRVGYYFLDFLVENKVIVELKAKPQLSYKDIKQVLSYLKVNDIELGLLINFGKNSLEYRRILNSDMYNESNSGKFGKNSD